MQRCTSSPVLELLNEAYPDIDWEKQQLTWGDIDLENRTITVREPIVYVTDDNRDALGTQPHRIVSVPNDIFDMLKDRA